MSSTSPFQNLKLPLTDFRGPPDGSSSRTYLKLLQAAMILVGRGYVPSIAELALHAGVSRATAYRCFPNRTRLIAAVVNKSLGELREYESVETDGRVRIKELFSKTFLRFAEYEPQLRAALQLALEHEAKASAGLLEEEQYRRGYRVAILDRVARPLQEKIGRIKYKRLVQSLTVVYGIEPYVVLRDFLGLKTSEIEKTTQWIVEAIIDKALADS